MGETFLAKTRIADVRLIEGPGGPVLDAWPALCAALEGHVRQAGVNSLMA